MEQALWSVRRALAGIDGEVWVVDNHSADDSVAMVRSKFPEVQLIANQNNPGFAVANNQAIRQSSGEFVLLLNPDTLVEEVTFSKCLDFMAAHPDCGALGVKLIDGSGKFLPESKRGFPTPWAAFCKTFGLSALFPQSKWFNQYYLGHLSEHETHTVDVLAGCFMFMRRSALDRAGLLDEAFFMYGEDIDLSYRITQAGFKNYYFPDTQIIHYKGESTKKGSLNYVKVFYQAMIIFSKKHFQGRAAGVFVQMLHLAIWLRAGLTLLKNMVKSWWLPLTDAATIFAGLIFIKNFWENYYYHDSDYFKSAIVWFNFPLYVGVWCAAVWLSGGYDAQRRYDLRRLLRGIGFGTLVLAAIYGFLDLDFRPSRAVLLLGAAWAAVCTVLLRAVFHFFEFKNFNIGREREKNLLIVGSKNESERVQDLLRQVGVRKNFIGTVAPQPTEMVAADADFLNDVTRLDEVVRIFGIEEIIFCSRDLATRDILAWMTRLGSAIQYKIVPEQSMSIIGSNSKNEPGELYTIEIKYNIAQPEHRRSKRFFDLVICFLSLLGLPVVLLFFKNKSLFFKNWLPVLLGKKTWVGYAPHPENGALPALRPSVFHTSDGNADLFLSENTIGRLNFLWARDWSMGMDGAILWRVLR